MKLTHWFPAFFLVALIALIPLALISTTLFKIGALGFTLYLSAILVHAYLQTRNVGVALLSVPSVLVQMIGYGSGFLKEKFSSTDRSAKNKRRV